MGSFISLDLAMVIPYSCMHFRVCVCVRALVCVIGLCTARAHTHADAHTCIPTHAQANPSPPIPPIPDSLTPSPLSTTFLCHVISALSFSALLPSVCACLSFAARYPSPPSYDYPSSLNYDYPSPRSYPGYDIWDWLLPIIIVAALIFLIQLVAICIAFFAFKQRHSCDCCHDCCYDNAGIPNCPSAQPVLSSHIWPRFPAKHTINDV